MQGLHVRFFGEGSIQYNGEDLYLPYAKVVEVLFVLLHERRIGRLKLCDLIWNLDECDETRAKKNLRHVIYTIRKCTSGDLIQSPKRETLLIGENYTIHSDLAILLDYDPAVSSKEEMRQFLPCYSGPFLMSCQSPGTNLEQWIDSHAQSYRRLYVDKLRQTIERLLPGEEYDLTEQCCQQLLTLEEYDESCCVALMTLYQKTGRYADALEVYQKLETRLAADLSVRPLPETTEAYLSVKRSAIQQQQRNNRPGLYGRNEELRQLRQQFDQFSRRLTFRHCMISGEAGIGKTALIQTFLRDCSKNHLILNLCCYELEESFMLRLWDRILDTVAAFITEKGYHLPPGLARDIAHVFPTFHASYSLEEDAEWQPAEELRDIDKNICALFATLREQYNLQMLIAVDDLQWIDDDSLTLLTKVLFANQSTIMLVASHREDGSSKLKRFYYHLGQLGTVERIALSRFTEDTTRQFINLTYPEMAKQAGEIYTYSEGNPLFLVEILNNIRDNIHISSITDKMARLVEGRILHLSGDAQKLMAFCSMFYDDVTLQTLIELVELSEGTLMDAVEELVNKKILRETVAADGAIQLTFTHSIICKYVYDSMPKAKQVIMHSRIAKHMETQLRGIRLDRVMYPKLIHHYEKAENKVKLFEYALKQMQLTFNVCHELFPVLESEQDEGLFDEYVNEYILRNEFKKLWSIYHEIRTTGDPYIRELQILFLYLYGRFSNGSGNLPVALETLTTMMELAASDRRYDRYSLRGAVQLIQYAINCNDLDMMRQNVERALLIANRVNDMGQAALAYRHFGYYHILQGAYSQGEAMLEQSRKQFESLPDRQKYKLHIAATYFFTGESKYRQDRLQESLDYYEKTLELCNVEANLTSAAVLYLRFGYIHYRLGHMDLAMDFLLRSIKAYERIIFIWGRADAYYYLHKVYQEKKLWEPSCKYRRIADKILSDHKFQLSL